MSGFNPDWLALREPYDHSARDSGLATRLAEWLSPGRGVRVMDLGCGTGSNLRYLAPRLPQPQNWRLVDHDSALVEALARSDEFDEADHHILLHDLSTLASLPVGDVNAVVASALMDLVSLQWFHALAGLCREAGAAMLTSITYNGHMRWQPILPDDGWIETLFNAHQRGEKHFGAAMGPDADTLMSGVLENLGYRVARVRTPWVLEPADVGMQNELLFGIVAACLELKPLEKDRIMRWSSRRGDLIDARKSHLMVGHGDILALPPEASL